VGASLGAVAFVCILLLIAFLLYRKRLQKNQDKMFADFGGASQLGMVCAVAVFDDYNWPCI
jgi:hypothetical protein